MEDLVFSSINFPENIVNIVITIGTTAGNSNAEQEGKERIMCGAELASEAGPFQETKKSGEKRQVGTSAPTPQVSCLKGVCTPQVHFQSRECVKRFTV